MDFPADDSLRGRMGLEYGRSVGSDWNVFLRTGYATSVAAPFTLGAGVEMKGVGINYAFSPSDELGASNRLDLRWRFGSPLAQETRRALLYDQTRAGLAKGPLAEAEVSLEEARVLSPHSIYVRQFQRQIALQTADSLDPEVLFDQARGSFEKGDMGSAELAYRKILLVRPGNMDAQKGLEKIAAMAAERRNEEARVAVARAKERKKQELPGRARDAMQRGEWAMPLAVWQEVLELDPKNGTAPSEIVLCRDALAREARSRAAEAEAQRAEGVKKYEEGRTAYRAGDLTKANALFEEAVRLDPGNTTYRRALERARQETGPRVP